MVAHPMQTAPDPLVHRVPVAGTVLVAYEWHPDARDAGDAIVLAHATGFHARCWDQVVARLGRRRIVALDQRGHGRSDGGLPVHWRQFGEDLAALVRALELGPVLGVGHSMGGHATVEAAALEPARFRRLVLIDPVIAAPDVYLPPGEGNGRMPGEHPTARRRDRFASPDEICARFAERPPFDAWDPRVLRDYCTYGARPDPAGDGWILACRPAYEAEIYMTSRGNGGIHRRVRAVQVPVLVIRAMEPPSDRDLAEFRYSPTWPGLAAAFPHGRDMHLADRTHFLPMEDPALAARLILEAERAA
jgi:pimeloyl-ACP methyl ester carboxylesterase